MLAGELCLRRGYEELRCEGEHRRAGEYSEFAQFFGGEGCLEGSTSSDDGDVAYGGTAEDVEYGLGDVVLLKRRGWGEQHARNVQRDVALADYGDMLCLV